MSKIEEKLDKLSSKKEIWIAIISAVIAAISSVFAAYYGYQSEIGVAALNKDVATQINAVEIYKKFGDKIISGKLEERCRALQLITTIQPDIGVKQINENFSKNIGCNEVTNNEFYTNISSRTGKTCKNTRASFQTERNIGRLKMLDVKSICKDGITVPDLFNGPYADGSVTFDSREKIDNFEIWCNCLPTNEHKPNK